MDYSFWNTSTNNSSLYSLGARPATPTPYTPHDSLAFHQHSRQSLSSSSYSTEPYSPYQGTPLSYYSYAETPRYGLNSSSHLPSAYSRTEPSYSTSASLNRFSSAYATSSTPATATFVPSIPRIEPIVIQTLPLARPSYPRATPMTTFTSTSAPLQRPFSETRPASHTTLSGFTHPSPLGMGAGSDSNTLSQPVNTSFVMPSPAPELHVPSFQPPKFEKMIRPTSSLLGVLAAPSSPFFIERSKGLTEKHSETPAMETEARETILVSNTLEMPSALEPTPIFPTSPQHDQVIAEIPLEEVRVPNSLIVEHEATNTLDPESNDCHAEIEIHHTSSCEEANTDLFVKDANLECPISQDTVHLQPTDSGELLDTLLCAVDDDENPSLPEFDQALIMDALETIDNLIQVTEREMEAEELLSRRFGIAGLQEDPSASAEQDPVCDGYSLDSESLDIQPLLLPLEPQSCEFDSTPLSSSATTSLLAQDVSPPNRWIGNSPINDFHFTMRIDSPSSLLQWLTTFTTDPQLLHSPRLAPFSPLLHQILGTSTCFTPSTVQIEELDDPEGGEDQKGGDSLVDQALPTPLLQIEYPGFDQIARDSQLNIGNEASLRVEDNACEEDTSKSSGSPLNEAFFLTETTQSLASRSSSPLLTQVDPAGLWDHSVSESVTYEVDNSVSDTSICHEDFSTICPPPSTKPLESPLFHLQESISHWSMDPKPSNTPPAVLFLIALFTSPQAPPQLAMPKNTLRPESINIIEHPISSISQSAIQSTTVVANKKKRKVVLHPVALKEASPNKRPKKN